MGGKPSKTLPQPHADQNAVMELENGATTDEASDNSTGLRDKNADSSTHRHPMVHSDETKPKVQEPHSTEESHVPAAIPETVVESNKVLEILEKNTPARKAQLASLDSPMRKSVPITLDLSSSEEESEEGSTASKRKERGKKQKSKSKKEKSIVNGSTSKGKTTASLSIQELKPVKTTLAFDAVGDKGLSTLPMHQELPLILEERKTTSENGVLGTATNGVRKASEVFGNRRNSSEINEARYRTSSSSRERSMGSSSLFDLGTWPEEEESPVGSKVPHETLPTTNQHINDLDDLERETGEAVAMPSSTKMSLKANEKRIPAVVHPTMSSTGVVGNSNSSFRQSTPLTKPLSAKPSNRRLDDLDEVIMNEILAEAE